MIPNTDLNTFTRKSDPLYRSLVILAAFAIRVHRLGSVPDTVLAERADNVQDSVRILCGNPDDSDIFLAQQFDYTLVHSLMLYESNC